MQKECTCWVFTIITTIVSALQRWTKKTTFVSQATGIQMLLFICAQLSEEVSQPFLVPWIRFHCVCFPQNWWNLPPNKLPWSPSVATLLGVLLLHVLKQLLPISVMHCLCSNKMFLFTKEKPHDTSWKHSLSQTWNNLCHCGTVDLAMIKKREIAALQQ